jgi:hypothetical protein
MKRFIAMASFIAVAFASNPFSHAQNSEELKAIREEIGALKEVQALRREVEGIREGQRALQKDLQEIKSLLQARPAAGPAGAPAVPQNVVLDLENAQVKGEKGAKLVLVEFTDYQ